MAENDPIDVAAIVGDPTGVPIADVKRVAIQSEELTSDAADFDVQRLRLARHILCALAAIFIFVVIGYVWVSARSHGSEAAKEVFEFVKETFPPIVTLILGAYFTRKSD